MTRATLPSAGPTASRSTFAARALFRLMRGLERQGVPIDAQWQHDDSNRGCDTRRVTADRVAQLWRQGLGATRDGLLGARIAATEPIGRWGDLEQLLLCCRDLEEMILYAKRFWPLVADGQRFDLVRSTTEVRLQLWSTQSEGEVARQLYESELLYIRRFAEIVFGPDARPQRVELKRTVHAETRSAIESLFGIPVVGSAEMHALVFSAASLRFISPCYSPTIAAELLSRLEARLVAARSDNIVDWTKSLLRNDPTMPIHTAAARFMIGPRAFQRRLEAAGASWRQLKDEARKDRAIALLQDPREHVTAVAAALGYSEPSVLHRSFKRWTGMTIARWRAQQRPHRLGYDA